MASWVHNGEPHRKHIGGLGFKDVSSDGNWYSIGVLIA